VESHDLKPQRLAPLHSTKVSTVSVKNSELIIKIHKLLHLRRLEVFSPLNVDIDESVHRFEESRTYSINCFLRDSENPVLKRVKGVAD
jgi:hypothetical protein